MKPGSIDLILLTMIFISIQFWWIRITIKNGRTGEVNKWGQKISQSKRNDLDKTRQYLEKLFKS